MFKRKFKVPAIIIMVETLFLIASVVVAFLYYYDEVDVSFLTEKILLYISLGLAFVSIAISLISFYSFDKIALKKYLTLNETVGVDIKETYLFAKVGLLVTDEEDKIIWASDLILKRNMDVLGMKIYDIFPELREFIDETKNLEDVKVVYDHYSYDVKYLKNHNMYIFKDVTELDDVLNYNVDQSTCIGIVTIDNYEQFVGKGDEMSDSVSSLRTIISSYFKKFNCILRSFKNDTYLVITNYKALNEMKEEGFSLLDEVKKVKSEDDLFGTLSIGFAFNDFNLNTINDSAFKAVDIALTRGGDQVVINKYGSELEYFGGRTISSDTGSRAKLRIASDTLINIIKESSNVIIMGHGMADMDAIGSALGLKALCEYCKKDAYIVYDPKLLERKTRQAIASIFSKEETREIFVSKKEARDLQNRDSLLIITDVSVPSLVMFPDLLEQYDRVVIVDHHRRGDQFIENPVFFYIEPASAACSEIVAQMIKYGAGTGVNIPLKKTYATIMLSGITLDSNGFKSITTGEGTFEAAAILKEYGADSVVANELLKEDLEEHLFINTILSTIKTPFTGITYCVAPNNEIVDPVVLSILTNKAVEFKSIDAAFAIGRISENEIKICGRSNGNVNVQLLLEKLGGGGHYSMAATVFEANNVKVAENKLLDVLNLFESEARATKDKGE